MSFDAGHTRYSWPSLGTLLVFQSLRFTVYETLHSIIVATVIEFVVSSEASHAGSATGTATGALVMSRQSITTSKLATTFFADMRPFPGM
jgi:hypothetical protein